MIDDRLGGVERQGAFIQGWPNCSPRGLRAAVSVSCGAAGDDWRSSVGCAGLDVVDDVGKEHIVEDAKAGANDGFCAARTRLGSMLCRRAVPSRCRRPAAWYCMWSRVSMGSRMGRIRQCPGTEMPVALNGAPLYSYRKPRSRRVNVGMPGR